MKAVSLAAALIGTNAQGGVVSDGNSYSPAFSAPSADPARKPYFVGFEGARNAADVQSFVNGNGGTVTRTYGRINAMSIAGLPEAALEALARRPGVSYVEEVPIHRPFSDNVPYGMINTEAYKLWDADLDGTLDANRFDGSGKTVCVIDSGLCAAHEDYATKTMTGANYYGAGSTNSNWDSCSSSCNHGNHCAGTVLAQHNNVGVVGAAPGANLWVGRVFGADDGGDNCDIGAYGNDIMNGVLGCYNAGHRIASMSLGGTFSSTTERNFYADMESKGMLTVVAAGNSGNSVLEYPASYPSVMSVGATDINNVIAGFSSFNSEVDIAAPGVGVLSTVTPGSSTMSLSDGYQILSLNYLTGSPVASWSGEAIFNTFNECCTVGDTIGAGASGNVVHCRRGTCTFAEKYQNARDAGAVGVLISNNIAGDFAGTLNENSVIPVVGVSDTQGAYFDALATDGNGVTSVTLTVSGGGISGYAFYDGTSMACPHVAGIAAAIWSAKPEATAAEVRTCLETTALDLGAPGRDNYYGWGLVQASAARECLQPFIGCSGPEDCDDSNPCTVDACVAQICQNTNAASGTSCPDDANVCTNDVCDGNGSCGILVPSATPEICGNGIDEDCDGSDLACFCGNGSCDAGEDCSNCAADCVGVTCVCGNGVCEVGEDCTTCSSDCDLVVGARCGDGVCNAGNGETCQNCPNDCNGVSGGNPRNRYCCGFNVANEVGCDSQLCGTCTTTASPLGSCCGDDVCEGSEGISDCAVDCLNAGSYCGDGTCDADEDPCNCITDCTASTEICNDGVDNDGDCQTDCADSDCSAAASCNCGGPGAGCSSAGDCCSGNCKGNGSCK